MKTLTFKSKTGNDGKLKIDIPIGEKNTEFEVVLVLESKKHIKDTWPENFIQDTFGSFKNNPIERPKQLKAQERDNLL